MLIIRPSKLSDLDALLALSQTVGDGMTSMPNCEVKWKNRLTLSHRAFTDKETPSSACFFMVLEDTNNQKIVGTTAIYNDIGTVQPFYSLKQSRILQSSDALKKRQYNETLTLTEHYKGATEVGSLFLTPEYRLPGVGQMLARSRYLLMADSPEKFSKTIMAELRGWIGDDNRSPLWEALGSKFFDMTFQEAVEIAATKGSSFITELMPKHPIYSDLLPKSAKQVLGKPNTYSAPALRMLEKEGFTFNGLIDLFDGGPSVDCQLDQIYSIKESCFSGFHSSRVEIKSEQQFYVSNASFSAFNLTMTKGQVNEDGSLTLPQETVDKLSLEQNAHVRYIPVMRSKKTSNSAAA